MGIKKDNPYEKAILSQSPYVLFSDAEILLPAIYPPKYSGKNVRICMHKTILYNII